MTTPQTSSLTLVPYLGPSSSDGRRKRRQPSDGLDTEETGPRRAMPKIKNACYSCKTKKTRCSGQMPCTRCLSRAEACRYPPGSLSSSLTSAATSRTSQTDPPSMSTRLVYSTENEQVTSQPLASCLSSTPSTQPLAQECVNIVRSEDHDNEVGQVSSSTPQQEDQYGHIHGNASVFAFLNLAKQKLASLPSMSIDFCDYPLTSARSSPSVLPPKQIADQLVKTYFNFGLSTSRFVHEPTFRKSYEMFYDPDSQETLDEDTTVLIYMVLAVGSHYSKFRNSWCGYSASVQFYEMAEQRLRNLPSHITLTSVQARLITVHYLLNHSRMHEAWFLFGIVVRHAQAIGLHSRSRRTQDDCIVHEYRKRVFWVIYINDRILSSVFGRPCAIHDDDVDQEECALSNDEEIVTTACQPTPEGTVCLAAALLHYARLARILGRVLRQFYRSTPRRQTVSQLYHQATEFEAALGEWQSALPDFLNFMTIPSSALSIPLHRQISTLKLTYGYANLLLYRPFMLHSMGSLHHGEFGQWVKRCHDESIKAANMIVSECQALQKRGLFSKVFWMCNYAQFAAIGTLYMYCHLWPGSSDHIWKIAEEARSQLPIGVEDDLVGQRYIDMLSELSKISSTPRSQSDTGDVSGNTGEECLDDDALGLDLQTIDFGGPWSNLFFDPTMFVDFLENNDTQ